MIYDSRRDIHDSLDVISLYASPNFNAKYTADSISNTHWAGDYPKCSVCGRSHSSFAVHHEPPRSKGSLLLVTDMGQFVIKPTLILLCESCHRKRHDGGLKFFWEWKTLEDRELFLTGRLFANGYSEHDKRFHEYGRLIAIRDGKEIEL